MHTYVYEAHLVSRKIYIVRRLVAMSFAWSLRSLPCAFPGFGLCFIFFTTHLFVYVQSSASTTYADLAASDICWLRARFCS